MTDAGHRAPRVSVVVPAYNRAGILGRTIDSVIAQTMGDWELVVSDDGSTDATADVAAEYAAADPRIRVISAPNGGVATARNRGFDATDAGSEFVTFLDSDDRWFPDTLDAMVTALAERPDLAGVYGLARCIDGDDQLIPGDDLVDRMRERFEYQGRELAPITADRPTTFAGLLHHNYTVTPGLLLLRRAVLEQVGPFDPTADPADDWDMAIRISRIAPIGFLDRLVLEWRQHPDTLTGTSPRWRKAYYRVRAKTITAPENTPRQQRQARTAFLAPGRGGVRQAWGELRRRQVAQAARSAARAGDVGVQYLGVAVPHMARTVRWRRSTTTTGTASEVR